MTGKERPISFTVISSASRWPSQMRPRHRERAHAVLAHVCEPHRRDAVAIGGHAGSLSFGPPHQWWRLGTARQIPFHDLEVDRHRSYWLPICAPFFPTVVSGPIHHLVSMQQTMTTRLKSCVYVFGVEADGNRACYCNCCQRENDQTTLPFERFLLASTIPRRPGDSEAVVERHEPLGDRRSGLARAKMIK
jgi:hypothetical protein